MITGICAPETPVIHHVRRRRRYEKGMRCAAGHAQANNSGGNGVNSGRVQPPIAASPRCHKQPAMAVSQERRVVKKEETGRRHDGRRARAVGENGMVEFGRRHNIQNGMGTGSAGGGAIYTKVNSANRSATRSFKPEWSPERGSYSPS